jgi:hypothetical protein
MRKVTDSANTATRIKRDVHKLCDAHEIAPSCIAMCTSRPPVSDIGPCVGIWVVPESDRTSNRIGRYGAGIGTTVTSTEQFKAALAAKLKAKYRESRQRIYVDFESVGKMQAL